VNDVVQHPEEEYRWFVELLFHQVYRDARHVAMKVSPDLSFDPLALLELLAVAEALELEHVHRVEFRR